MGIAVTGEPIDRRALEKQWANHEAQKLGHVDRALWQAARYTIRPYVYFNKVLIAWTVVKGEPQIKEVFKVTGVDMSFQGGVALRMYANVAKREITLTHSPRRILPNLDILAWVPFFNEIRFASADWGDLSSKKNLRLHVCLKMRENGDDMRVELVEGQDYLSELHVFREMFPQYRHTRF